MKKLLIILLAMSFSLAMSAQQFEASQIDSKPFKKVTVKLGGDIAMQYQALNQHADSAIVPIGKGVNLPTANMNISSYLAPGIEVHMTIYLSSKHHEDTWVKGGYLLIDRLPFKGTEDFMKYFTLKAGVMELNYGDAHFFRTDNGNAIHNPFIGNLIMDAFTTAPGAEVYYRNNGFLLMGALSSGSLKPSLVGYSSYSGYKTYNTLKELAFYWKAAYDKTFNNDLRLRLSVSGYHNSKNHFGTLYYGDRTGSRFYLVMVPQTHTSSDVSQTSNPFTGRWGPGFTNKLNSYMFNIYTKYKGLELFGTYEIAKGTTAFVGSSFNFSQYALNALYYFGKAQNFYIGGHINGVKNDQSQKVLRVSGSFGWYLTKNILVKADYVKQTYTNFSQYGNNAGFNGLMFEAAVSF